MPTFKRVLNPLVVVAVLAIQLATPIVALADDPPASEATPTEIVSTETPLPPEAEATPVATENVETPAVEEAVTTTEVAAPTEEPVTSADTDVAPVDPAPAAEEPVESADAEVAPVDPAPAAEETTAPADTPVPVAEEPAASIEVEVTPIVTEILEQAPAGTEVVALTNKGKVAPLDTLKAVEIISSSDPVWCPDGVALGDAACTTNQASITDLIAVLSDPANGFTGDGTIYFQEGNYDNIFTSETIIAINNSVLPNLGSLTLWGGWDIGGTNTNTGTTSFTVPIVINWGANITLRDIIVDFGAGGSTDTGIYVETTGDIVLDNIQANNGSNGADLVNYGGTGDVTVTDSNFSDNTNTGLNIITSGEVTVDNTVVTNNNIGIAVDNTDENTSETGGANGINLSNIIATDNAWTGIDARSSGSIYLENVTVTGSQVGAYLDATHGSGLISVLTSAFNLNTEIGLKAITGEGNIQLTGVTTDSGLAAGSLGAWLKSYSGGTITITDSVFDNAETGLFIVGTNDVVLDNVSAGNNAGNGVEIQSGWVFACIQPNGIDVTVNGGDFHNNGGYGFAVYPGPKGSLTLSGIITYLANTKGDYLLDLERTCEKHEEKPPSKPYKDVEVPDTGGTPVPSDCEEYKGTLLHLPDGSTAKVVCPVDGDFIVERVPQDKLPGALPTGPIFVDALTISLKQGLEAVTVLKDGGYFVVSFKVPEEFKGKRFSIMYWDVTAKDGAGTWVELPREQFAGQEFPLHPETPEDGMEILRGVYDYKDYVSVKVNFTGTFALIAR